MSGTMESPLHLKQTARFIEENPTEVTVMRRERQATSAGGHTWGAPVALAPQRMRKVGIGRVGALAERTTADGRVVVPTASVVAMPDADLKRFDILPFPDGEFEIVFLSEDPKWRLTAEVIEHGV